MTLKELQIGKSAIVDAVGGAGALRQDFFVIFLKNKNNLKNNTPSQ